MTMALPAIPSAVSSVAPFYLCDGQILSSLSELRQALVTMKAEIYHHHVSPERNDFSSWVRDVFRDGALAERLRHATTRFDAAALLDGR